MEIYFQKSSLPKKEHSTKKWSTSTSVSPPTNLIRTMCHQLRKKKKFQLTQEAEALLCVAQEREEMTSKHLMPVPRRSRSSFYASGFHTQLKKPTGTSLFFCTNVIKSMAEKQRQAPSRGGGTWLVFTEFIYLSSVLFLFFFLLCFLWSFFLLLLFLSVCWFDCQSCSCT